MPKKALQGIKLTKGGVKYIKEVKKAGEEATKRLFPKKALHERERKMSAHKGYTLEAVNRLIKIRDMRYKQFMSVAEIAKKLKTTRQNINQLLNKHYPLHKLIDVEKARRKAKLKYKLHIGDEVLVWLPVEASITEVHKEKGYTVELSVNARNIEVSYLADPDVIFLPPKKLRSKRGKK